jgi:hypothetical protein
MQEASDQRDSLDEIVGDLQMYFDDGEPIEVWFANPGSQKYCEGFVVTIGADFVLIARLHQRCWLNGFRAIRLTAIEEVLPADDPDFVLRAMRARGHVIPPVVPFHAETLEQLLARVCDHYPIVIIDDPDSKPPDAAGIIREVENGRVRIRRLSSDGRWLDGLHEVDVRGIDDVFFASQYEETLRLIGELPDS